MALQTHETAPTRFIEANGIRYAYRSFGKESGVPLVFLQHFQYPDSGHGSLFQYPELFVEHASLFLRG